MSGRAAAGRIASRAALRDRARRAMQAEVGDAAMEMFLARGFEQTTVEQILEETGISRSTFFRYFPTKEDVVVGDLARWGEKIYDALAARPGDEDLWLSLRHAMDPLLTASTGDAEGVRAKARMLEDTPALRARRVEKTLTWQAQLVPEVARRMGLDPDDDADPRPSALVAAALGCLDAATRAWVAGNGDRDAAAILDAAVSAVRAP